MDDETQAKEAYEMCVASSEKLKKVGEALVEINKAAAELSADSPGRAVTAEEIEKAREGLNVYVGAETGKLTAELVAGVMAAIHKDASIGGSAMTDVELRYSCFREAEGFLKPSGIYGNPIRKVGIQEVFDLAEKIYQWVKKNSIAEESANE